MKTKAKTVKTKVRPTRPKTKKGTSLVTARDIVHKGQEVNARPLGYSRALQDSARSRESEKLSFDPKKFGARFLGKGKYAIAYAVKVEGAFVTFLENLMKHGRYRVLRSAPRVGDWVVVKFGYSGEAEDFIKEATVHAMISNRVADSYGKCVIPPPPIPDFFVSSKAGKAYIVVMGMVRGVQLKDYVKARGVSTDLYLRVERAVVSMWLAGISHSDLHGENVLVRKEDGHVYIIDFGFAVILKPEIRRFMESHVAAAVAEGVPSLAKLWELAHVTKFTNRIQYARSFTWYNPDVNILKRLYDGLSDSQKARIPALRRIMWKC